MISYPINTWRCQCGYSQDFEMTQENADIHFNSDKKFPVFDLKENECPSCAMKNHRGHLVTQETDISKMSVQNHLEQSDIDALRKELEEEETQITKTGKKIIVNSEIVDDEREETVKEKEDRIEKTISQMNPANPSEIAKMREKYEYKGV